MVRSQKPIGGAVGLALGNAPYCDRTINYTAPCCQLRHSWTVLTSNLESQPLSGLSILKLWIGESGQIIGSQSLKITLTDQ
ncbi:hypothetical protein [Microcystis aeruginosa]|uniref:hypothetical protein n=1 Tax=Microcystis aeruginosa TaxID=1126 RepID=UPI0018801E79|nr:hypothetical protein [Microcystis aeruginosa]MBE8995491.1 hypothetical protein [Microcystis aeruginosa LEGE 91341]